MKKLTSIMAVLALLLGLTAPAMAGKDHAHDDGKKTEKPVHQDEHGHDHDGKHADDAHDPDHDHKDGDGHDHDKEKPKK